MTTTTTTQYTNDLENKYEIDKLIKKFSYSIKQQEKNTKLENSFKTSLNEKTTRTNLPNLNKNEQAALLQLSNNNNLLKKSQYKESFEVPNNDKAIFFNTLKSLFAIFDPDCKGSIDLNELNTLGAQKNEILNDVINYLFTNREEELNYNLASNITQQNYNNNNSSNCSSRSSSANSNKTKHSFRINNNNKPLIEENFTTQNNNSTNINNRRETRSPSANQINKKLKQFNATNKPYYVTFESFAHAAELILDKRKQEKLQMYQQIKRPQSNYNLEQYSTIVTVQPPPPIIASRRPNSLVQSNSNYTSLPIVNATANNGATLSQAFENVTNKSKLNKTIDQIQPVEFNTTLLKNANSLDLGNLLDKEQFLLKQGLNDLDSIRQWFLNQLKDNKIKQQNVHKLKHQNLFTIDKMLTDLKQLNDLNSTFRSFITTNNHGEQDFESLEMDLSTTTNSSSSNSQKENFFMNQQTLAAAAKAADLAIQTPQPLPSYKDYLDQYDLNKSDSELDSYLKEKQDRIDHLQKEKSFLIRRLFEMKSEAASLNTKLPGGNRLNYEIVTTQPQQAQATSVASVPQKLVASFTSSNSNDLIYNRINNQQKHSFN